MVPALREESATAGNDALAPVTRASRMLQDFMLSIELASQYQHIAFLCYNKIETSKSRLNVLDFAEWSSLAGVVMAKWGSEDSLDLDSDFTDMMRLAKETLMVRALCMPSAPARLHARFPHTRERAISRLD